MGKVTKLMPKKWKERFRKMGPNLEDDEVDILVESLLRARGDNGVTEEEAQEIIDWAEGVRIEQGMLDSTLQGSIDIDWDGEECTFKLNESGKERAEQIIADLDKSP